ncbi:MAG: nickel pincer cofactor biosynthesis protein LarC [Firmicutes bacterium]|nr:nickel pincer cofactor biosynthesis protein LarC [Bacillota bacterium]
MANVLCLDAPTGIAGDMLVAALTDLGASWEKIERDLRLLPLSHWQGHFFQTQKNGLSARRFQVDYTEDCLRDYRQIREMLQTVAWPQRAKDTALRAFAVLAQAEAKAHGCLPEQVHFHEVGAVDSLVDIGAAALAADMLQIEQTYIGTLPWSRGSVQAAHGRLPLPAPAVRHLLTDYRFETVAWEGELITPTGAALLAALSARQTPPPPFTLKAAGCGAGTKDFPVANILYAVLGEEEAAPAEDLLMDEVAVLTANVDDCSGELLAALWEKAAEIGVLDLSFMPIWMKKGRPAWQIMLLIAPERQNQARDLLLRHTTVIGLRFRREKRWKLPRQIFTVDTEYGPVAVKQAGNTLAPEYESVKQAAEAAGATVKEVYYAALSAAARKTLDE